MTTRFDWHQFLIRYRISFVVSGPNVAKNNVAIKCPWCGAADPSEHLGLSLNVNNPVWGCLRNAKHRGRSPVRLVAKLLRLSYGAAVELVDQVAPLVDDFDAAIDKLRGTTDEPVKTKHKSRPELPQTFRRLFDGSYGQRFIDYLSGRGFHNASDVSRKYDLFYSLVGDFAWRLIFPVTQEDVLIGWTGRDIREGAKLRYRASDDLGKDVLLSFHNRTDYVLVVEGPVDALKIDYYGREFGVGGVAMMGTAVTEKQKRSITDIAKVVPTFILFDAGAEAQSLSLANETGARWLSLPSGFNDPGEMDRKTISKFLQKIVK